MNFIKSNNFYSHQSSPEKKLFIAILSQAVHDAFSSHVPLFERRAARSFLLGTVRILERYVKWQEGTQIMSKKKLKNSYTKPIPYIKELAKNIGMIRKKKPHWDIFQVVAVVQRIMRSKKYKCPHN